MFFGILGLMQSAQVSWIANPLILISIALLYSDDLEKDRFAVASSISAFILGNVFLFQGVNTDEGSNFLSQVSSIGLGYWLWMISIVFLMLVAIRGVLVRTYQQ